MNNSFDINIIPDNDDQRIEILRRYQILETPPEDTFDHVAKLATQIFQVPIALVSLVDKEYVYFKANVGMGNARVTERGISLCSLAILQPEVTVFQDASKEVCLLANPLVAGQFGLKFYAGAPLITHDGYQIGTLCIIDKQMRAFSDNDKTVLEGLSKIVMDEMELRLSAILEKQLQQQASEEVAATTQEIAATNEELRSVNKELTFATERQAAANKELRAIQERLKLTMESSGMSTWEADLATDVMVLEERTRLLHGLPEGFQLPFSKFSELIDLKYRSTVANHINEAILHHTAFITEYFMHPMNGSTPIWLRSNGSVQFAEDGQPVRILGAVLDITEQKADEQRKNDFIGMVSHELKTPLTSLHGYLQLLELRAKKMGDVTAVSIAGKAGNQSSKMKSMINGFLNVSRLESGKIHIERQRFDMAALVKESEDEVRMLVNSHHFIFEPVLKTFVDADREKIGQVINNLLSNAVKYSPMESTIHVACVTHEGCAKVSIRDEGLGIGPEDKEKLFDRYYRAKGEYMKMIAGFGIGLYLCKEIIDRHEGSIGVESALGQGSTFWFSLPTATDA